MEHLAPHHVPSRPHSALSIATSGSCHDIFGRALSADHTPLDSPGHEHAHGYPSLGDLPVHQPHPLSQSHSRDLTPVVSTPDTLTFPQHIHHGHPLSQPPPNALDLHGMTLAPSSASGMHYANSYVGPNGEQLHSPLEATFAHHHPHLAAAVAAGHGMTEFDQPQWQHGHMLGVPAGSSNMAAGMVMAPSMSSHGSHFTSVTGSPPGSARSMSMMLPSENYEGHYEGHVMPHPSLTPEGARSHFPLPGNGMPSLDYNAYIEEMTGKQDGKADIYPCPHCDKVYTGKHARSIWRRHLQDKHEIPLSAQPRRTRWDNDTNRPKTEAERRERCLESKRKWARKNRATRRARAQGISEEEALQMWHAKEEELAASNSRRRSSRLHSPSSSSEAGSISVHPHHPYGSYDQQAFGGSPSSSLARDPLSGRFVASGQPAYPPQFGSPFGNGYHPLPHPGQDGERFLATSPLKRCLGSSADLHGTPSPGSDEPDFDGHEDQSPTRPQMMTQQRRMLALPPPLEFSQSMMSMSEHEFQPGSGAISPLFPPNAGPGSSQHSQLLPPIKHETEWRGDQLHLQQQPHPGVGEATAAEVMVALGRGSGLSSSTADETFDLSRSRQESQGDADTTFDFSTGTSFSTAGTGSLSSPMTSPAQSQRSHGEVKLEQGDGQAWRQYDGTAAEGRTYEVDMPAESSSPASLFPGGRPLSRSRPPLGRSATARVGSMSLLPFSATPPRPMTALDMRRRCQSVDAATAEGIRAAEGEYDGAGVDDLSNGLRAADKGTAMSMATPDTRVPSDLSNAFAGDNAASKLFGSAAKFAPHPAFAANGGQSGGYSGVMSSPAFQLSSPAHASFSRALGLAASPAPLNFGNNFSDTPARGDDDDDAQYGPLSSPIKSLGNSRNNLKLGGYGQPDSSSMAIAHDIPVPQSDTGHQLS